MTAWLQEQGQQVPDHHAAHEGMPGMATPEQLDAPQGRHGPAFDRLFLAADDRPSPGRDHDVEQVLTGGSHIRIEELANDIAVTQLAEIRRMRQIQAGG